MALGLLPHSDRAIETEQRAITALGSSVDL